MPAPQVALLVALLVLLAALLWLLMPRAAGPAKLASAAARAPASSPPSPAPRVDATASAAAGASYTPRASPAGGARTLQSLRDATCSVASEAAEESGDGHDVGSLGASLGAAAGAALAPTLRLRAAEEASWAEAAPPNGAVDDAVPATPRQPLAARVAAAAPALARHAGAVLLQHDLLPPPLHGVEDAVSDAAAVEPVVPVSPPACGPALGAADGHRFVAAFCEAFEEHALASVDADGALPLTPLAPLAMNSATPLAGISMDAVAQLMALASGEPGASMPPQQLSAMKVLNGLRQTAIAAAALQANVAELEELKRANERRERKDAEAKAVAAVAVLRGHAADALVTALIWAAAAVAFVGWRTARALPRAMRDCFVHAGLHRYDRLRCTTRHAFQPLTRAPPAFSRPQRRPRGAVAACCAAGRRQLRACGGGAGGRGRCSPGVRCSAAGALGGRPWPGRRRCGCRQPARHWAAAPVVACVRRGRLGSICAWRQRRTLGGGVGAAAHRAHRPPCCLRARCRARRRCGVACAACCSLGRCCRGLAAGGLGVGVLAAACAPLDCRGGAIVARLLDTWTLGSDRRASAKCASHVTAGKGCIQSC